MNDLLNKVSKCAEKQPGLGRRAVPRAQACPAEDEGRAPSPGQWAHPQGSWQKDRATWERRGPFKRADLGKLISAVRNRVNVALRGGKGCRAVKGGHRREESYYKHTLHVLTKGRRARTDHRIIRESNGHVH